MSTRAIFDIEEVYEAVKEGKNIAGSHLGVPGNSKGCGGIIDIAHMIPESAVLFVAPLGCARHVTTHPGQRDGNVFSLALEEAEIVTGAHIETVEQAILEIYDFCKKKPKLITICGSCIDRLMATDFELVAEKLADKIPARILVTWMDPVIGRKEHPQIRCWDKVYSIWKKDGQKVPAVNLIGRLYPMNAESEFRVLLNQAGISPVHHMADCETLEAFYEMGTASLNILGSNLGEKAAKKLQRTNGIPYLKCLPTFSIEKVHSMYRQIEGLLNIRISDEEVYEKTKKEIMDFREKWKKRPIHAAIGEAYACNEDAFSMARDAAMLGIQVDWIYSDGKLNGKEEQIRWLAENQKQAKVVFLSHPGSREMMMTPPDVDFAWGMNEKWFIKKKENHWIDVEARPIDCDYASISWFLKRIEQEMEKKDK